MPELPTPSAHHPPPAHRRAAPRARIAHAIPGRVRIRLHYSHPEQLERVRRRLAAEPGVSSVDVDTRTGSILVLGAVTADILQRIGSEEGLFHLIAPQTLKPLEEDMARVLEKADHAVRRVSGGQVGLMGMVVASLAALAAVQIARGRFDVPAPTLLWYTLSAALMLRSRPAT